MQREREDSSEVKERGGGGAPEGERREGRNERVEGGKTIGVNSLDSKAHDIEQVIRRG